LVESAHIAALQPGIEAAPLSDYEIHNYHYDEAPDQWCKVVHDHILLLCRDSAGWKTDRGRIYISYGPPDEIDTLPADQTTPYPIERWKCRYIEGVGKDVTIEFTDLRRSGEVRIRVRAPKIN
jgi:hypothetical protein